jgi:glycosyltransferase involved in cell wall biosynthesis
MNRPPRIAFATREVWPFVAGGGLGRAVWACAGLLAPHAEVTVITSAAHRERHAELMAAADPRLPAGVRFAFADEPGDDVAPWRSWHHAWSAALLDAIVDAHPDGMPDLIELPDYLAESAVTAEAKRTGDPRLRHTLVLNRIHTTFEIATALNRVPDGPGWGLLRALERVGLRSADRLVWPGGDVFGTYERFYGAGNLAPPARIDLAFSLADDDPATREVPEGPLRLLHFGRFEWRKGVQNLVQAVRELPDQDVELTLLGRDTPTAPGGGSLRAHLETLIGDDPRITFHEQVPQEGIEEFIRAHHVVVAPSLWESWSNVVREALMYNRPALATPVGAMIDVIEPGRSGWLTTDTGVRSLRRAIAGLVADRSEVDRLIGEGAPRAVLEASRDDQRIVDRYLELATEAREQGAPPVAEPVTVVVTSAHAGRTRLLATLDSVAHQTLAAHVVLVCDPATTFPPLAALERVSELAFVPAGDHFHAHARRVGLERARGGAVAFLESGDVLAPEFLERASAGLARSAYVTALGALRAAPLGNIALGRDAEPAAIALYRRDVLDFELPAGDGGLHDDQALFVALAQRERFGAVVPEVLIRAVAPRRLRADRTVTAPAPEAPAELWLAPWAEGDAHPRDTAARAPVSASAGASAGEARTVRPARDAHGR